MLKIAFLIKELRLLGEELNVMADDIERDEGRIMANEEINQIAIGRPYPPGGRANWEFMIRKFENISESVMGELPTPPRGT